jgi:hypothetical protein
MSDKREWLVWSEEHGAWWGGSGWLYVRSIQEADRYTLEDAQEIVRKGNLGDKQGREFNEIAVLDPMVWHDRRNRTAASTD